MEEVSVLFRKILFSHRSLVQSFLTDYGLYMGQPRVLFYLKKNPGSNQNDLANFLEISKEATSVSVRRLEKAGFIERKECKKDRRKNLLFLSKHGSDTLTKIEDEFNHINYQMYQGLDDTEINLLRELFTKILYNLEGPGENNEA